MSIQDTTRQALSVLFPDTDASAEQTAPEDTEVQDTEPGQEELAAKEISAETTRSNGIVEHDYQTRGFHLDALLDSDQLLQATQILFDLGYFLESITGVDWIKENQFEVVYDFSRYDFELCRAVLRVTLDRTEAHLPTITPIYTGANWHERETHDFFGIVFDGHPHLIPLLLPEDADFHPLLKDFSS
jgi:NADH-quinone oxidoreductase subunit C